MKNKLYFYYGGFSGPFYEILCKDKQFEISLGDIGVKDTYYISSPPEDKWETFWCFLDENQVWKWKKNYINQNVLDGTQWELDFSNSIKKIKSYGSNKFPNKRDFKKLINQIEILLDFKLKKLKDEFNEYKIEYQKE